MLKKTKFLVIALLVLFISLGAVCAQENITADNDVSDVQSESLGQQQTVEVVSDGDIGDFGELRNVVSTSVSGSTINLTKDYKHVSGDGVYSSGITIDKTITINGNGHTIDASDMGRIFSVTGSNVVLKNIVFTNSRTDLILGAVYVTGSHFKVINSTFKDNVGPGATAIRLVGDYPTVEGCKFINNYAYNEVAAAIFLQGNNGKIINTLFDHNTASTPPGYYKDGGAVYVYGVNTIIDGCNFTNNVQLRTGGGALYLGGFYGDMKNCRFINNSAVNGHGGGASILGFYWDVFNTTFENNTASTYGGGLFFNAQVGNLYNLTFDNNKAHMGGAAYLAYDTAHNTYTYSSYSKLSDSVFKNNHAIYGGGAIDTISNFQIENCEFINNSANNYGGAVCIGYSKLNNSRFRDNKASFGGAIFSYSSKISNSDFAGNEADYGNSVYVVTHSELINNNGDEDAHNTPTVQGVEIKGSHDVQHMLETKNGYYGFCTELYNCNPYTGVFDDSMNLLKNSINGQPVKEYLKILIYQYLDNFDDLKKTGFHNYVWAFTDGEYWNSQDPVVQTVVDLYNSGFRVPSINACKVLPNGTLMYINFSSMITPSSQQNLFLFKFTHGDPINQTMTKDAIINKTIYIGDDVEYRLVINNKGTSVIYDSWVEDNDHGDGLVYKSWRAEYGNWSYNEQMHRWYVDALEPGKSASIVLKFEVTLEGLIINKAISGSGDKNVTKSGAGFEAKNPNMTVEKKTLTPSVKIGDQVEFDIIVKNTGNITLENVFVCESEYDAGLVYVDFASKVGTWKHSVKEGKHVFTLTEKLEIEDTASFTVIFKATKSGTLSNTVVAGFNDTTLSNSTNTTEVEEEDNTTDVPEDDETDETNDTEDITDFFDGGNITDVDKKAVFKTEIDDKATGNPLMILLAALIFLPLRRFKN